MKIVPFARTVSRIPFARTVSKALETRDQMPFEACKRKVTWDFL
jgi:hypothetical protein